ncbi:sigma-70 family RNA polymerase sigma factor, partial [Streptomyces sp. A73]|nr:sigma-70 family RNA polymerase sigma factor [Streptomyces sp. A73]
MADHTTPIAELIASLDGVEDPAQRSEDVVTVEAQLDEDLRGVRQRIALELRVGGLTYREVGEVMGGV